MVPVHHTYEHAVGGGIYGIAWGGGLDAEGIATPIFASEAEAREDLARRLARVRRRPAVPADYPLPITGGWSGSGTGSGPLLERVGGESDL